MVSEALIELLVPNQNHDTQLCKSFVENHNNFTSKIKFNQITMQMYRNQSKPHIFAIFLVVTYHMAKLVA